MAASPHGDVLQCLEWGDLKRPGWTPIPVAVQENGTVKATALALRRSIPHTRRGILYVPRGPIVDWSDEAAARAIVKRLREAARRQGAILIKIDPAVPMSTHGMAQTLGSLGFRPSPDAVGGFGGTQPRCVMKLDIAGTPDDVMARFHQKWRYNIRLAARKGVVVQSDCTRADLPIFHELYRTTAERDGFTGRPLAYFEKLWDTLVERDLAKLFITYLNDQPLSSAICFVLPPQAWYVYGASSNEQRNVMPNHAMQWAMMQWARERDCTLYDFRGVADEATIAAQSKNGESDNHLQGLNRFKTGFGATQVDYIGEWDLVIDRKWYWLWTTARPKAAAIAKKVRRKLKR